MGRKRLLISAGFTIVELLIVVVVITVLASISIVAYAGVQERARYSAIQQDLKSLNTAINLYYTDNGNYPTRSGGFTGCGTADTTQTLAIDGLVPAYSSKIPVAPNDGKGSYYAYCVSQARDNYKILRLTGNGNPLPSIELTNPGLDFRLNANGSRRAWGLWSPGGAGL